MLLTALAVASFGTSMISGALGASAARKSARASMAALEAEKTWNLGVMRQNKIDTYAKNVLSSFGAGISAETGSNKAIIEQNQDVLEREIRFQEQQYNTQISNLRAQSKQKFLGIF